MLIWIKSTIKEILSFFNLKVSICVNDENSDDPFIILSKVLDAPKTKLVIDGGASIGETTQRLSALFPKALVHAFEPFPDFHQELQNKANLNPKIIAHHLGLGKCEDKVFFNVNKSQGTNSILKSNNRSKEIYGEQMSIEKEIQIPINSVDNLFSFIDNQCIDILKLDLQGYELDALIGATKLLEKGQIKVILCEVMFEAAYENQPSWIELVSLVEKHDLSLFNLYQRHYYQGRLIQADLLFMRNDLLQNTQHKRNKAFHNFSEILRGDK
jgi:FkbM family methyltransferase